MDFELKNVSFKTQFMRESVIVIKDRILIERSIELKFHKFPSIILSGLNIVSHFSDSMHAHKYWLRR